ncbi:hypothetical protein NRB56_10660 [Nocardia sp. RB56]|uniref:Uncharacterized protein n=1 Tax=Nocardia aurantia TaxID=2585199 RepID=A0A7K0DIH7_9NOCA|nr:hypothetical protein [Nocardia aurantia]
MPAALVQHVSHVPVTLGQHGDHVPVTLDQHGDHVPLPASVGDGAGGDRYRHFGQLGFRYTGSVVGAKYSPG